MKGWVGLGGFDLVIDAVIFKLPSLPSLEVPTDTSAPLLTSKRPVSIVKSLASPLPELLAFKLLL